MFFLNNTYMAAKQPICNFEYKLKTPPAATAVTLAEAKAHLMITGTADDAYITALISAVTGFVEKYLNIQLITQTWLLYLDFFPCALEIVLKKRPVAVSPKPIIRYYPDTWNKTDPRTVFDATKYIITEPTQGNDSRIMLFDEANWPDTFDVRQAVEIEFVAGVAASDIPQAIKEAMLLMIAFLFENRGDCCNETSAPKAALMLLNQYKIYRLGCCDG